MRRADERHRVAIHEAAHFIVSEALGGEPLGALVDGDDSAGICFHGETLNIGAFSAVLLAGRLGEAIDVEGGRALDLTDRDVAWLRAILDVEARHNSDEERAELLDVDDVVLLEEARLAADLLASHWHRVRHLANQLYDHGAVKAAA